jgi:uncharacterized protein
MTAKPLTPSALASHLSCGHYTQLERQRRAGTLKIEFPADPRLETLQQRGFLHEAEYVEQLRAAGRSIKDLTKSRDPADTIAAMREGHGAIVQAPIANDLFFGIADVLLRCEEPSALGGYSYEPVDTKLTRETRASTILQLVTYCDAIGAYQGKPPEHFHVVTPIATETYRRDDFVAYYRLIQSQFVTAAGADPPPQTYPEPVPNCDLCKYWSHCDKQRRNDDYPSLVAGIRQGQVREFQMQGIATVSSIAQQGGVLPAPPRRGRRETYVALGQQASLQVRARTISPPPLECLPYEIGRGFARLPEPNAGDIFLDFEGDPFVGDGGLEYLTGYHVRDAAGATVFRQDWAFDRAGEKAACERFIDFAIARWAEHPGLHIYHFGAYEPATLKRLCARHETRREELDRFLRGGRFIDLHVVVRESMRIGIERYGLKELEQMHGFKRLQDLADAAVSRRDVELALELGDFDDVTGELKDHVAKYNAEDCLSTEALRNWLEARRAERIAAGTAVERPPLKLPEPTDEVAERDRRIQSLKDELLAALPADQTTWSDDHKAIALLASLLGYFRQEEKNAWWEHFRLRDLPRDEQMDERQVLAGLEYVETVPKVKGQRSERRRYRFPPQECTIAAGDKVIFVQQEDPAGGESVGTTLTVQELDPARGEAILACSKFGADTKLPTAVFAEQVVKNEALELSVLALAEHVRDHGLAAQGSFAAASALLRAQPPRGHRTASEDALSAAKRISLSLDHEVLPIQGPPGSGKTFTGARVILELVRAGKRIGVCAVSHKVIDNLLGEVRRAARDEDCRVRVVHKHSDDAPAGIEYVNDSGDALDAVAPGCVVGGTAWLWADSRSAEQLDYLFIDEAGQMSLAQALAASRCANNLVLLGDPQQLEQPQRGSHPPGADVAALVHLLGPGRKTLSDEQGLFLEATYRLHPDICRFTSECYYEGRLKSVAGLERQQITGPSPYAGAGLFLVEVAHEGNQAVAPEEVDAVADVVSRLLRPGVQWTGRDGATRPLAPSDILVVAPYNAQVAALRNRLSALGVDRVGTVDKFQGQEAAVVIYSCTSSSPEDAPRGMSFLYDPHRFNVATSRAQGVVIVVASPRLFEPDCRTPEQMRWANALCRFREMARTSTSE